MKLKVKDVMRTRNLVSVRRDDDVAMAAQLMAWAGIRHLPVLEAEGADDAANADRVVGVFTERDLLRYRAETGGGGGLDPVGGFMSSPAETIAPDAEIAEASARIIAGHLGCLPVVDGDDSLIGIVTTTDLVGLHLTRAEEPDGVGEQPRVSVAMKRNPATVRPFFPLLEAVGIMVDRDVRHVPVTDDDGKVIGIISDSDVRTAIGDPIEALQREWEEVEELQVSTVMTTDVVTVRDDASLLDAARAFIDHRIGAIPVLDAAGRIVGILSYVDVLRALRSRVAAPG